MTAKIFLFVTVTALAVATAGCQRDDSPLADKLDSIEGQLETLGAKVDKLASGAGAARGAANRPRRPRPAPKDVYSVPVADAPVKGNPAAKVTVVKAFEFACPYCERVRPTMEQLLKDYGDDVRIVYKHYVVHPQSATTPALAACAANYQGKFGEMEALIWDKGFKAGRNLSKDNMVALAKEAGLDVARFQRDMSGPECGKRIRQDQAELARVGVSGTPAFYINGRFLAGARAIDQFKVLVNEELKKANARIAKGEATAADYYDKFVLKAGKKKLAPGS